VRRIISYRRAPLGPRLPIGSITALGPLGGVNLTATNYHADVCPLADSRSCGQVTAAPSCRD
jgi:hypothetical protein